MIRSAAIFLNITLVTALWFGVSQAQSTNPVIDEDLLLGLATRAHETDADTEAQELYTAWIVRHGKTAQLVAVLPSLLVPRPSGFWRVGITTECEMYSDNQFRSHREIVWAVPATVTPRISKGPDCPSKLANDDLVDASRENTGLRVDRYTDCLYRNRSIRFVSPNYISEVAMVANTEACEERGFRWDNWSRVVAIDTPEIEETHGTDPDGNTVMTYTPQNLSFAQLSGTDRKQASEAFDRAYAKGVAASKEGGFNCAGGEPDYLGWLIDREDGMWMPFVSQQMFRGNGTCEVGARVPFRLPASLVGPNRLVPPYQELKTAIRDLTDAFSSPTGDTLIAVAGNKLLVFEVSKRKLRAKLLSADIPPKLIAIMDQWATRRHVQDWTQQVHNWQSHPPAPPIISAK